MKTTTAIFLFAVVMQSCDNKSLSTKAPALQQPVKKSTQKVHNEAALTNVTDKDEHAGIVYPKTGNKASDFLPESNIYDIEHQAAGDLNRDGLPDMAVVLIDKEVLSAERPLLILLQNKDGSYRLDKISTNVLPQEYSEDGFQMYISEEISVENGTLKIESFGMGGPVGNLFSHFKYSGNDLILTYIETYDAGAGGWQSLYYDLEKGEFTEETTNTMKEDMPSETRKFDMKKIKYKFENASPSNIIMEAHQKTDNKLLEGKENIRIGR